MVRIRAPLAWSTAEYYRPRLLSSHVAGPLWMGLQSITYAKACLRSLSRSIMALALERVAKSNNPLASVLVSVLAGLATFLAVLVSLLRIGRSVTSTLDGLVNWAVLSILGSALAAFACFGLMWWRLSRS